MPSFLETLLDYELPLAVFDQLHRLTLEKGADVGAFLLADTRVSTAGLAQMELERFVLLISPELQVLLIGRSPASRDCLSYQVGLAFEPSAVADFLDRLINASSADAALQETLQAARPLLQSKISHGYSDLALTFLQQAIAATRSAPQADSYQAIQITLNQQTKKSLLLDQIVNKIQQSLDLAAVLDTTVAQVQQFLQCDRLAVYQFEDLNTVAAELNGDRLGAITYESRLSEHLPSMLNHSETGCEAWPPHNQRYQQGLATAIPNIQKAYAKSPCLLAFLEKNHVKSKLVAPILVGGHLWGLLIAHQCQAVRYWQPWELEFLQHVAARLAIAISQAQLSQQIQQQRQTLEAGVIERTQALHDALIAAQSANRAKGEFLATMSHELRTPLTCIIGMSATLLRWSIGDLNPRQRSYLDTIHTSGAHLLNVINDILEVSKIESGRTALDISQFSLSSLVRQSVEGFQEQANQKQIQLISDLKIPAGGDLFMADPRRLKQILQNLLSNAIKFTPDEGTVKLRLRFEQQVAVFQVEDTGIGIPESQHGLLFEKFQQLETTRHRQYQGTGLGLALTKHLVDLHGGAISVQSRVGSGSIFTVRLPVQTYRTPQAAPSKQQATAPEPVTGRIILVEEQEEIAGIICDMLTSANYQVIWLVDGSQIVNQVELLQPVATIVDLHLTSASGQQIINGLRRYAMRQPLKILAVVASENAQEQAAVRQMGADEVIYKPIDPEELLRIINVLMAASSPSPART
ncbi:MAG: GAF domain-containing protein [Leptolyngbyaceae cyanobacterium SM1_1_3]|nr:GAF domain-containing protein [Leptolyngbyaceae cyanobacterium SM1_1_3]NJN04772.1 GAF domain-containing protein [Leptolyngbyaceae cyanobacterium RM1_1_2]NJO11932.1 GAF domain-containing protein [Leptolyngbyaceae cyanobacterium SL_1_1]